MRPRRTHPLEEILQILRLLTAIAFAVLLTGCAALVAPPYAADFEAVDGLKKQSLAKVTVGEVQPRDPAAPVNRISLRGASLVGAQGSFARYLEDALVQDLKELSIYDPASQLRIDAVLLKNDINVAGISTGTGQMEVEMSVVRGTNVRMKKVYSAATEFPSSFAGAVAIPKGQSEYSILVKTLLGKVYRDPEFVNALKQ
jgi:hypothetical protein